MEDLIQRMRETGILPVIQLNDAKDAIPLAQALKNGGLRAAEVTFRTDAAEEAIRQIASRFPDFLLIEGTVLTPEQADRAMEAGADGLVSPGANPTVVRHCLRRGYPIVPGVCTPSEVEQNLAMGLDHLKFFPAQAAGGLPMLRAMAGPYPRVRFMPTGGISTENAADYLRCGSVFACGGSWIAPAGLIAAGQFAKIETLAREAMDLVRGLER